MPADAHELRHVPLFALLDDDELSVLAQQVELKPFAARQRIYKLGDPGDRAYILMSGAVQVTTVDEDQQQVIVHEPKHGEFFGFASMLDASPHQTSAMATEDSSCLEIDRNDISILLQTKPLAGMDMMTVLARQFHASQALIRVRATRNPNVVIEEKETAGERIADRVASFGGSWTFIIIFAMFLGVWITLNALAHHFFPKFEWDQYPYILLNLFLSMIAAMQAPVIMMSQNRQDKKDRVRSELGFDVTVRSESEIQALTRRIAELHDKLDDVDCLLRKP